MLKGGLRIIGITLRSRPLSVKAEIVSKLTQRIWPAIESGTIRPVDHQVLPIGKAEQAHDILHRRENIGKAVLRVAHCSETWWCDSNAIHKRAEPRVRALSSERPAAACMAVDMPRWHG